MHIGGIEHEVRDLRSEISRKADQHEVHSLNSTVCSLEHTVREFSSQLSSLRSELQAAQERIAQPADGGGDDNS